MPHTAAGATVTTLLIVIKGLILILGGIITYFAFKAYRRTRDRSLGLLALGFGFVVIGAILGGMANELIGTSLAVGVVIEGFFVLLGFALIALSLRITT